MVGDTRFYVGNRHLPAPTNFFPGYNLVPRGPFCHALEISGPLARSNDIPVLNGCVNTID